MSDIVERLTAWALALERQTVTGASDGPAKLLREAVEEIQGTRDACDYHQGVKEALNDKNKRQATTIANLRKALEEIRDFANSDFARAIANAALQGNSTLENFGASLSPETVEALKKLDERAAHDPMSVEGSG